MKTFAKPDTALRDLWIDGVVYQVPPEVHAHFAFLSSLISTMSDNAARLAERVARAEGEQFRPHERGAA